LPPTSIQRWPGLMVQSMSRKTALSARSRSMRRSVTERKEFAARARFGIGAGAYRRLRPRASKREENQEVEDATG
jgi:hypothetical protein